MQRHVETTARNRKKSLQNTDGFIFGVNSKVSFQLINIIFVDVITFFFHSMFLYTILYLLYYISLHYSIRYIYLIILFFFLDLFCMS